MRSTNFANIPPIFSYWFSPHRNVKLTWISFFVSWLGYFLFFIVVETSLTALAMLRKLRAGNFNSWKIKEIRACSNCNLMLTFKLGSITINFCGSSKLTLKMCIVMILNCIWPWYTILRVTLVYKCYKMSGDLWRGL